MCNPPSKPHRSGFHLLSLTASDSSVQQTIEQCNASLNFPSACKLSFVDEQTSPPTPPPRQISQSSLQGTTNWALSTLEGLQDPEPDRPREDSDTNKSQGPAEPGGRLQVPTEKGSPSRRAARSGSSCGERGRFRIRARTQYWLSRGFCELRQPASHSRREGSRPVP